MPDKYRVRVILHECGEPFMTRAQARSIIEGKDGCFHLILDYTNIQEIGEDFADEIYNIFAKKNPQVRIKSENMSKKVRKIIEKASKMTAVLAL